MQTYLPTSCIAPIHLQKLRQVRTYQQIDTRINLSPTTVWVLRFTNNTTNALYLTR
jgi:hypothetical protein